MDKLKKIKIILGISYSFIIIAFLWAFFTYFSLNELTSYDFIKNNRDYLIQIKDSSFSLTSILFLIFTIIWVLLLGFGSPIFILGGFIFGKWFGSIFTVLALSFGATLLYIFANFFFKDFIYDNFYKKFESLNEKFKKNEFLFILIYRFVGGIPFAIANILPTIFNVKVSNYFFGTLIGMYPQAFVWVSLGSGIEKIINQNLEAPSFTQLISSPDIYIPILGFLTLIILGIIIKNLFYKK
tara:strand:+ start:633 stop:1352 length:720 start_codon:yes stop_codon:yes gene_type:complete